MCLSLAMFLMGPQSLDSLERRFTFATLKQRLYIYNSKAYIVYRMRIVVIFSEWWSYGEGS